MMPGNEHMRSEAQAVAALEALLQRASPRPAPPAEDEQVIREAVLTEWQAMTRQRRLRRRLLQVAVAATVVLALGVSFNQMRTTGIAPVQVATISKSYGSIYVLGEQAKAQRLPDASVTAATSAIMAGQMIKTDHDSGIGLAWGNGGSLRIAAETIVEFVSATEVYLHTGRIYFDSTPSALTAGVAVVPGGAKFRIQTDHGTVTHFGTQYMTYTTSNVLEVSVREGEVGIHGRYHDERALAGQQLSIAGSSRATVLNIDRHGAAWGWVEDTAPAANTDGRSIDEFLRWVGRETGMRVAYPDAATEQAARATVLKGNVNLKPSEALSFWLQGQDLQWITESGTIKVSAINGGSGQ
jgi:ferric-dicitrate binding protein FerR (iron transport regulator)